MIKTILKNKKIKKYIIVFLGLNLGAYAWNIVKMPFAPSINDLLPCLNLAISQTITQTYLIPLQLWIRKEGIIEPIRSLKDFIYARNILVLHDSELKIYWWYQIKFKDIKAFDSLNPGSSVYDSEKLFLNLNKNSLESEIILKKIAIAKEDFKNSKAMLEAYQDILSFYIKQIPEIYCKANTRNFTDDCYKKTFSIKQPFRESSEEHNKLILFYEFQKTIPASYTDKFSNPLAIQELLANIIAYDINKDSFSCNESYVAEFNNLTEKLNDSKDAMLSMMTKLGFSSEIRKFISIKCLK